jgi:GNAT superfamily N-acetyltransferase
MSIEESAAVSSAPDPRAAAEESATVRPAREAERPRIAKTVALAFYDDPVMRWCFRDDSRRLRQLERLFGFFGDRLWFGQELTYTTHHVAGGAIWEAPDRWHVGVLDQLRMTPGLLSSIGLRDLPRAIRVFNLMESKHPHDPHHYYLPVIGVAPQWQGKGLGTALLRPMLERCDRERMPAYLEATSARNRVCYERNGFQVHGEIVLPDGPTFWPMWREPAAA